MSKFFEDSRGNKYWKNDEDKLHRIDGPAYERYDGSKYWWINDKLHRIDGPAVESINNHKTWYLNGKCHRLEGPAIEYTNGTKYWYLSGQLHDLKINKISDFLDLFGVFCE